MYCLINKVLNMLMFEDDDVILSEVFEEDIDVVNFYILYELEEV